MTRYYYDFYVNDSSGAKIYGATNGYLTVGEARAQSQGYWNMMSYKGYKGHKSCAVRKPNPAPPPPNSPTECYDGFSFTQQVETNAVVVVTCGPGFEWSEAKQNCVMMCPPGMTKNAQGGCEMPGIPARRHHVWSRMNLDEVFALPVPSRVAPPRVVRWIEPSRQPRPRPFSRQLLPSRFEWTLSGVGVGAVVLTDTPSIIQAKAGLFAWSKLPASTNLPFVDYGLNMVDIISAVTWSSRDGEMLHAFSKLWNDEKKPPTLLLGSGTPLQAALTDLHLKALQTFISQQAPPGWLPPPTGLPSQATGLAQAECLTKCEKKYGITGESPDVANMATCASICLSGSPGGGGGTPPVGPECSAAQPCLANQDCVNGKCQPKLPPAPSVSVEKKSDNTALYVVGGVAAIGLLAAAFMGGKSELLNNPNLKRYHSLRQLGIDMLNWHGSMGDPVYAVGSFYVSNQPYPNRVVVERARNALSNIIPGADARKHGWTAKDARELRSMVRALDNILERGRP